MVIGVMSLWLWQTVAASPALGVSGTSVSIPIQNSSKSQRTLYVFSPLQSVPRSITPAQEMSPNAEHYNLAFVPTKPARGSASRFVLVLFDDNDRTPLAGAALSPEDLLTLKRMDISDGSLKFDPPVSGNSWFFRRTEP